MRKKGEPHRAFDLIHSESAKKQVSYNRAFDPIHSESATTDRLSSFVLKQLQRTVWAHSSETATTDRLGSFV
jgi:hypothetical protein